MFINLSNLKSAYWSTEQRNAAKPYGEIVDIPTPIVPPTATEGEVADMADIYMDKIVAALNIKSSVSDTNILKEHMVLVDGNAQLVYRIVANLSRFYNIPCVKATYQLIDQNTTDKDISNHYVEHKFVKFREY